MFNPPAAPHTMTMWSADSPVQFVSIVNDRAIFSRTSCRPALGMYRCSPGLVSLAANLIAWRTFSGGSITGFPKDKSNTLSAPCSFFIRRPSSNIFLIQEELFSLALIFFEIGISTSISKTFQKISIT